MNNKEKAFIILTPGFASTENDTTCLPMQQSFVKTMASIYPHLRIIVLSFQYPYYQKCYAWFNATVISFGGQNKSGLSKLLLRHKVNKALNKIHKGKEIVGLLSFWLSECAAVGKKFGKRNNIPHYCWLLGQDARPQNKYPKRLRVKENELIALSDFLQEEFERNYGIRPFAVVTPGIEQCAHTCERAIDLLAVGSLIPLKQFDIFIKTVAAIKKKIPGVKAVLVGEGPQEKLLMNLTAAFDVQENIVFTGKIGYGEVISMMKSAKILLHPSSYEGYSGVCQEALSNGAYVISFCRAMNNDIDQWHIVNSKKEMIEKCIAILQHKSIVYNKVEFQPMSTSVGQMMNFYL